MVLFFYISVNEWQAFMMLQNFLDYLKLERNYSSHTIKAYQNDLTAFQEFCSHEFEVSSLAEVGYPIIRSWILSLSKKGISNLSINRKVSSLKSFFKFLQKIGEIETNPLIGHKALKVQKKIQVPFSKKEILEVMDAIQGDDFESVRNRLVIEVAVNGAPKSICPSTMPTSVSGIGVRITSGSLNEPNCITTRM